MMGSAYPADDPWHPWYRQIRPFVRPCRFLQAHDRGAESGRADPTCARCPSEEAAVLCCQIRGWGTPDRCCGIHRNRPCPWRRPAQIDGDPFEWGQGQISTHKDRCEARHLTSNLETQANRPTIAINAGDFALTNQPDDHGFQLQYCQESA